MICKLKKYQLNILKNEHINYKGWKIFDAKDTNTPTAIEKGAKYFYIYIKGNYWLACGFIHKSRNLEWIKKMLDIYDIHNNIMQYPKN